MGRLKISFLIIKNKSNKYIAAMGIKTERKLQFLHFYSEQG